MTQAQPRIVRETIAYSHDRFDYERALREAKCDEDTIRRCLWANDMQRFNNFESYAFGGGGHDLGCGSSSLGKRAGGNSVSTRLTATKPAPMQVQALPASTLSLQPSAATVSPGLAASLTAQPQFFPGSRHPSSSPATCASPPPAAAALYDPDSLDVTSDNEPDLPWIGFEGDPDMDIPEF